MTFVDLCSGIGGGRLGLTQNGFKALGYSEIDKEAIKTYKSLYECENEEFFGDLTALDASTLPDFDLLISGFPCQSFSIVGKREGLCDVDKGQIIFYLADILKAKQPRFFILENVKGLVNHDKGKSLEIVLELLKSSGYKVSFKVLNSLDFGLAQSRERVYFVGVREDLGVQFSFDANTQTSGIKDFLSPNKDNLFDENLPQFTTFLRYLGNKYNQNRISLDELLKEDFLVIDTRQSDLRCYHNKVPTLRRDRQGILYVYKQRLYKLSGLEALNLQGFGVIDGLEQKIEGLKDSDLLRQSGNAMSVNVIQYLGKKIKDLDG